MKKTIQKALSVFLFLTLFAGVCLLSACVATPQEPSTEPASQAQEQSEPLPESKPEPSEEPVSEEPAPESVRVLTLKGPTGMGMAKLICDSEDGTASLPYAFTVASAPDQISAEVIKGSFDIAAVPVNLASVLYNKTEGSILAAGVNTLGVLYVLEEGETVSALEDLKGKTLYATGQGSTPEYVLNYILSKNGIDPEKDLTVTYLAEHAELATQMTAGSAKLGMLPEPNVTSVLLGNSGTRVALDLTAEWAKVSDTKLVQGVLIVRKGFAEDHPQALKDFLDEYGQSVAYTASNPDEAASLIERAGIIPKAAVAKKALPNCNIVLLTGEESKAAISAMLAVLHDANPASVGGKLPDEAFYLNG